ncbi:hypothetical protein [Clostridium perfringens]|uniref:hypothetical protein n=1 Tax=Clostridium perfringens TaxID=1502 RepID=UPI0024BCB6D2|nr:hypothetical protein [Clostridium perfringens]
MSLFLGKIHFWLFDKIKWFENLEEEVLELSKERNMPVEDWVSYANLNFGEKTPDKPLDEIIDESNIHGWLEARINSAEGRCAYYITNMLNEDAGIKKELIKLYESHGKINADECKGQIDEENILEVYNSLNDYILDGMPCDRINEVLENSPEKIVWHMSRDLHERFWSNVGGDVTEFHDLRNSWIKAFVKEINPQLELVVYENGDKAIVRK